jgi:hypothetical protein
MEELQIKTDADFASQLELIKAQELFSGVDLEPLAPILKKCAIRRLQKGVFIKSSG